MESNVPAYQPLLQELASDLGAARAWIELLPEDEDGLPEIIATVGAGAPEDELTWLDLPVREGSVEFACVRLGFGHGSSRPRPKPWRIAQTLAELVVHLNQMRWRQASQSATRASRRILSVTEEELQRVILNIHDGPVQKLFAASSQVEMMRARIEQMPPEVRGTLEVELRRVADLLQSSLGEIKTSLGTMRPPEFRRRPLVSVLQGLIMQHESLTGVSVELSVEGDVPPVSLPAKIAVYRILQEALSNAYRHAGVDRLDVKVIGDGESVLMEVIDAGPGFEPPPLEGPSATEREEHIGLRGMRDRAQLVGGQFRLFSHPGRGTRVQVRVPGNV